MVRRNISKRGGCGCKACKSLCRNEPGWFIPEEIEVAAKFLGISAVEFERDYCDEHLVDGVSALSPKMMKRRCIFLVEGLCKIHSVKPFECRKVYGCEPERRHKNIRENILKKWK